MAQHVMTSVSAESLRADAASIADEVIAIIRDRQAIDFSGYRRGTIERRIVNRMASAGLPSSTDYLELLRRDEREISRLAANLTVKVSRFFRNAAACDSVRDRVLPMVRGEAGASPLRIWSAGCATGEEAYTLAMLTDECDVVDATDIDEQALAVARAAEYAPDAFAEAPPALVAAHFEPVNGGASYRGTPGLCRRVRFLRHDLTAEEPPATYHLVACRNLLIYLGAELQQVVLRRLVSALRPGGALWLGEAEWPPPAIAAGLHVVDQKNKIFRIRPEPEQK